MTQPLYPIRKTFVSAPKQMEENVQCATWSSPSTTEWVGNLGLCSYNGIQCSHENLWSTATCTLCMNFTNNEELKKPDTEETHCMIPFRGQTGRSMHAFPGWKRERAESCPFLIWGWFVLRKSTKLHLECVHFNKIPQILVIIKADWQEHGHSLNYST